MKILKNKTGSTMLLLLMMMSVASLIIMSFLSVSASFYNKTYSDRMDKQAYLTARSVVDTIYIQLADALSLADPTTHTIVGDLIEEMLPSALISQNEDGTYDDATLKAESFSIDIGDIYLTDVSNPTGISLGDVSVILYKLANSFTYEIVATATVGTITETVSAAIEFSYDYISTSGGGGGNGDENVFYMDYGFGDATNTHNTKSITTINFSYLTDTLVFNSPIIYTGSMTMSAPVQTTNDIVLWDSVFNTGENGSFTALGNIYMQNVSGSTDKVHSGKSIVFKDFNTHLTANIFSDENLYIYGNVTLNDSIGIYRISVIEEVIVGTNAKLTLDGISLYADTIILEKGASISGNAYANTIIFEEDSYVKDSTSLYADIIIFEEYEEIQVNNIEPNQPDDSEDEEISTVTEIGEFIYTSKSLDGVVGTVATKSEKVQFGNYDNEDNNIQIDNYAVSTGNEYLVYSVGGINGNIIPPSHPVAEVITRIEPTWAKETQYRNDSGSFKTTSNEIATSATLSSPSFEDSKYHYITYSGSDVIEFNFADSSYSFEALNEGYILESASHGRLYDENGDLEIYENISSVPSGITNDWARYEGSRVFYDDEGNEVLFTSDYIRYVRGSEYGTYYIVIQDGQTLRVDNSIWGDKDLRFILEGNATLFLPGGIYRAYGQSNITLLHTYVDNFVNAYWNTLQSGNYINLSSMKQTYHTTVDSYYNQLGKIIINTANAGQNVFGAITAPIIYSLRDELILQIDTADGDYGGDDGSGGSGGEYEGTLSSSSTFKVSGYSDKKTD